MSTAAPASSRVLTRTGAPRAAPSVARSEADHLRSTLRQLGRAQVVTVSDIDGFARAGGMVELAVNPEGGNLLNILINRKAAQAQNIQFNAQLLRLARVVEP